MARIPISRAGTDTIVSGGSTGGLDRGIRVAGNGQVSGDVHPPRPGFVQHSEGEDLPRSEDGGGRVAHVEKPR